MHCSQLYVCQLHQQQIPPLPLSAGQSVSQGQSCILIHNKIITKRISSTTSSDMGLYHSGGSIKFLLFTLFLLISYFVYHFLRICFQAVMQIILPCTSQTYRMVGTSVEISSATPTLPHNHASHLRHGLLLSKPNPYLQFKIGNYTTINP